MKRSAIFAWTLCLIIVFLATWQLLANGRSWLDMPFIPMLASFFWGWIFPVLFAVLGALIVARSGNRVGWLLILPALAVTFMSLVEPIFAEPPVDPPALYWLVLWVYNWSWIAIFFPVLLLPLHFPNGRPPTPPWRWLNWLAVFMWAFFAFVAALIGPIGPFPLDPSWRIANPVGFFSEDFFDSVTPLWVLGLIVLALGSVLSLIRRYRHAGIVEKEQIKWLLYAAALFGLAYALYSLVQSWLPGKYGDLMFMITLPLFSPLRRWVQNVIDRRFYRLKYDAQQVLAQFAQVARSETDLANLSAELLSVLSETFQPQSVGLWTAPARESQSNSE
ncbi:MAG: hypothetical protein ACK2U0_12040 [Candidatus Promineifilaceae bacterium]